MKSTLLITALLASALATGCNPSPDEPASQAGGTAARQLDQAQATATSATRQMQDYTFAQKTEFVTAMKAQLAELNRELDELSATIAKSSDAVKAEAKPKLAALREQAAVLKKQMDAAANATSSTWDGIKAETSRAYAAMKDGLATSRQWVSDKIAP